MNFNDLIKNKTQGGPLVGHIIQVSNVNQNTSNNNFNFNFVVRSSQFDQVNGSIRGTSRMLLQHIRDEFVLEHHRGNII